MLGRDQTVTAYAVPVFCGASILELPRYKDADTITMKLTLNLKP
jgi:hypothetical protein